MINFIKKAPKWPKILKADSAYQQSFSKAILNFEQNIIEERELNTSAKGRKFSLGSRL